MFTKNLIVCRLSIGQTGPPHYQIATMPVPGGAKPIVPLPNPVPLSLWQLVGGFARHHWPAYSASALMLACIALAQALIPQRVGLTVDGLVSGELHGARFWQALAVLAAMGVFIYLLRVGWRLTLYRAAHRLGVALRQTLYARLTLQGPGFFQRYRTGDLMARATNDIDAVEMAAGEAFLAGFDGTLTLVLVVAMMAAVVDARLAAIALLPFPAMALAFWWISRRVHRASRASLTAFADLNDHVQESIAGVRTIRAAGLGKHVTDTFERRVDDAAKHGLDALRWESAYEPAVAWTMSSAMTITLGVGAWLVWIDDLSLGELTAFTMYLGQLIWPMFAMGWVLSLVERGRAGWERLAPALNEAPSLRDEGYEVAAATGDLSLDDISYTYPSSQRPALSHVSVRVADGSVLGVVGPTGAGKSTLISLLLRHDLPDSGLIQYDGQDLNRYTLDSLRATSAWVGQEAFLFSASLAENIALASPQASREQIEHVARIADIHDDIMNLREGYDTLVGERGVTLSGGQRQRVAIARALLADGSLLLLDDALSAVDTETETRILKHLRQARQGRTTIVVTHRLSAVVDADQIIVLRDGKVVERGSHSSLAAANGWYTRQWQYQQLEASLAADSHP